MREDSPLLGLVASLLMTQSLQALASMFQSPLYGLSSLEHCSDSNRQKLAISQLEAFLVVFHITPHCNLFCFLRSKYRACVFIGTKSVIIICAFFGFEETTLCLCFHQLGQAWTVTHNWSAKSMIPLICWDFGPGW